MAERFYLQWNLVNWITVVLMAMVGMILVGAIASAFRQYAPGADLMHFDAAVNQGPGTAVEILQRVLEVKARFALPVMKAIAVETSWLICVTPAPS